MERRRKERRGEWDGLEGLPLTSSSTLFPRGRQEVKASWAGACRGHVAPVSCLRRPHQMGQLWLFCHQWLTLTVSG